jgi:hypothetical protein
MTSNKSDENNTNIIANRHNQSLRIAFDVKNDSVISNNTGIAMGYLNISWILPASM